MSGFDGSVSVSGFSGMADFLSYTERHYLPLLDSLSGIYEAPRTVSEDERRLLAFLHDDLTSMVNNFKETQKE